MSMPSSGSPKLDRTVLPIPDRPFKGVANRTLAGSKPEFPAPVHAPEGAPNVLLVLVDDAGFGNPATFGGPTASPTLERLAREGLRYNRFHVTALCSPSRAALLSGRNHHAVGFGSVAEFCGGWPGYDATWPKSAASIAEILRKNGYNTAAFGKWHLTPDDQQGPAGPFRPLAEWTRLRLFLGISRRRSRANTTRCSPRTIRSSVLRKTRTSICRMRWRKRRFSGFAGRNRNLRRSRSSSTYSTGASHAPHHVSSEWADKYKGRFDDGWDALRVKTFERQKKLGVIPADAQLTPRNEAMPAWDSLSAQRKRRCTPARWKSTPVIKRTQTTISAA